MTLDEFLIILENFMMILFLLSMTLLVLLVIGRWMIFEKAYEDGWKSIVPILSSWTLFKIAGMNPWLIILMLVPGVNLVIGWIFAFKFTKTFGFGVLGGLAFIFFQNIVFLYIAFSRRVFYRVPGQ